MFRNVLFLLLSGILFISVSSCKKDEVSEPVDKTVEFSVSASPSPAVEYTFFNFEKNALVTGTDVIKSTEWDFGLKLVSFIVNGGTDRTGKGGVIILENTFYALTYSPETCLN